MELFVRQHKKERFLFLGSIESERVYLISTRSNAAEGDDPEYVTMNRKPYSPELVTYFLTLRVLGYLRVLRLLLPLSDISGIFLLTPPV